MKKLTSYIIQIQLLNICFLTTISRFIGINTLQCSACKVLTHMFFNPLGCPLEVTYDMVICANFQFKISINF